MSELEETRKRLDVPLINTDPAFTELEQTRKQPGMFSVKNDPVLIAKWKPILEAYGISDPVKQKWMATYCENHIKYEMELKRLGIKTISDDLVQLLHPVVDTECTVVPEAEIAEPKPKLSLRNKIVNTIKKIFTNYFYIR